MKKHSLEAKDLLNNAEMLEIKAGGIGAADCSICTTCMGCTNDCTACTTSMMDIIVYM